MLSYWKSVLLIFLVVLDKMEKTAIIGYSGHAFVVLDVCNKANLNVEYYCNKTKAKFNPFDLIYFGDENTASFNWNDIDAFVLGIGDNKTRKKVVLKIKSKNKKILSVVSSKAYIGDFVDLKEGTVILHGAVINTLANIGSNSIINTGAIIEHECKIGDFTHIAPGAVLAGNVSIGNECFVGANSVIKQGVKIGNNVTIGAGSVVLNNINSNEIWVGNPAKKIKLL